MSAAEPLKIHVMTNAGESEITRVVWHHMNSLPNALAKIIKKHSEFFSALFNNVKKNYGSPLAFFKDGSGAPTIYLRVQKSGQSPYARSVSIDVGFARPDDPKTFANLTSLMSHVQENYPACCGLNMVHTFRHYDGLQLECWEEVAQELVTFMRRLTVGVSRATIGNPSQRFTGITVYGYGGTDSSMDHTQEYFKEHMGREQYPVYHKFFKDKGSIVESAVLLKNNNSNNIIENLVVRFPI